MWEQWSFEILTEILAKYTEWPRIDLKESDMKRTLHNAVPRTTSRKYFPFRLVISRFTILSFTDTIKFHQSLVFVSNVLTKFGWEQMKNIARVAFWNFQHHMVLCSQKF